MYLKMGNDFLSCVKVDWTPELHRRFVQAVEQLGVDKAVPSRILEIMGIDCLTRHNIASHLQVCNFFLHFPLFFFPFLLSSSPKFLRFVWNQPLFSFFSLK